MNKIDRKEQMIVHLAMKINRVGYFETRLYIFFFISLKLLIDISSSIT